MMEDTVCTVNICSLQVDYNTEQWIMKNMDPLNENVVQLFAGSSDWFLYTLWKDQSE